MAKVEIIGHRSMLDATLACVQRMGAVQLLDATSTPGLAVSALTVDERYIREAEQLRHLRTRLDALLALVPQTARPSGEHSEDDLQEVWAELEELAPLVEPLVAGIDEILAEQGTLPRHLESMRRLLPLVPEVPELEHFESVALLIERRHIAVLEWLRQELAVALGSDFELLSAPVDANTVGAIVVFPRGSGRSVNALLAQQRVSRVQLPAEFRGLPLAAAISAMERRLSALPDELEKLRRRLGELLGGRDRWPDARAYIDRRLSQLAALRNIGTTERAFAIVGWMPRSLLDELAAALAAEVGDEVLLAEIDVGADESPPVLLSHRPAARPFELLLRMLTLPRYGTFDPTVLMALFIPFFFGLMLGDIAYGVILGVLALWARHRWGARSHVVDDLTRIVAMGAGWAVVWGIVYGEVFGDLGRRLIGLEPLWLDREEAIGPLLVFAVAVGAAHIVLGLVLGLVASARAGDRHQFGERATLLMALSALFVIAAAVAGWLPSGLVTPSVGAVLVALVVLIGLRWPLGLVTGPLDLVGIVTNVLSYLRLAAIGLASVFLARVANELGTTGPLAVGLVVAALFHAMNLALGAFSPSIQALRLHYVEFFDKFYEPGGDTFRPFGGEDTAIDRVGASDRVPITV